MKKITYVAASLLIAAGYAGSAAAHTQAGTLNATAPTPPAGAVAPLNTTESVTDFYQLSCFDDASGTGNTDHVAFQIKSLASTPAGSLATVTVQRGNFAEFAIQSATANTYGTWAKVYKAPAEANGNGLYNVFVSHTKATTAAHSYTLTIHCENAANGHTGTTLTAIQNQ